MTSAAQSTSLGSTVTLGTASEGWYCTDSTGTLKPVVGPPTDCSATLTGSTVAPGDYISITASHTYNPIFPSATIAAALPSPITSTAWMRLK
jgi:hypothetical protein